MDKVTLLVIVAVVVVVGGSGVLRNVHIGHIRAVLGWLVVLVLRLEIRRWRHPSGAVDGHSALSASSSVYSQCSKHHDNNKNNENSEKRPSCATQAAGIRVKPTLRVGVSLLPINKHEDL